MRRCSFLSAYNFVWNYGSLKVTDVLHFLASKDPTVQIDDDDEEEAQSRSPEEKEVADSPD